MKNKTMYSPSRMLLMKNVSLNLVGNVILILVALISIPIVITKLGTERFGILTLTWLIFNYCQIFDLGITPSITKYISEFLGKNEKDKIVSTLWTGVSIQFLMSMFGLLFLLAVTPYITNHLLNINKEFIREATKSFYILAYVIPAVLVSNSFRGFMEAFQRFDLVNLIKVPNNISNFLVPLSGAIVGWNLPKILIVLVIVKYTVLISYFFLSVTIYPPIKHFKLEKENFLLLLKFGGWVTVSSIIGPILVYIDRFVIGSIISVTAVAFYSAPHEIVTRFLIIPLSLTITLFPAFSSLHGIGNYDEIYKLIVKSLKYMIIILGPLVFGLFFLSKDILSLWLSFEFAEKSAFVLQILTIGVFFNSLALIPFTLIRASNRPDIPAKFHILELLIYIPLLILFVKNWGIKGAAITWTLRVAFDCFFLYLAAIHLYSFNLQLLITSDFFQIVFYLIFTGLIVSILFFSSASLILHIGVILLFFFIFYLIIWMKFIEKEVKNFITGIFRRYLVR